MLLRRRTAEMLRVDHAGEYGAVAIYQGQRAVFERLPHKARMTALLQEMEEGEQHHLAAFDGLLNERRVRPTLLAPLWNAAGFALGAGTALLGEKAAMACTSAVESVIEGHYKEQADELGDQEPELRGTFLQFREDELGHHDTAIAEGAEQAPGYRLLSAAIKAGCRAAIRVTTKV
ncbi:demethoxyubiquinone hydroxylase family protein [Parvularcula dongshanensis]|uniref:3-demethoxyubiquinol 3-hydroxylase n=1 Tax=Parvularcula dongshanensis TaxID=1173995 RepID=A0A840I3X4_9PROT|nr:demethoxyubiquinone hydroxylase family protein [Parvularcula dongshanensis]MBB4658963.1 ubiquinone biosynthesis monooxygenase Coq7 [Parvularcula dongshanensis]